MSGAQDHYVTLGLKKDASMSEIKKAYRTLALECHPDRFPGDVEAEERFRKISDAYAVLSDPAARARYDRSRLLPDPIAAERVPTLNDAGDYLRHMFGDFLGTRKEARRRGRDVRYTLTVDLPDAVLGSTHTIEFEARGTCTTCQGEGADPNGKPPVTCPACEGRGEMKSGGLLSRNQSCGRCGGLGMVQRDPCKTCRGSGRVHATHQYDVRLPPGTKNGAERVLKNRGEPGRYGGESGHLRVKVNLRPHPWFEWVGDDICLQFPISITEAALGTSVDVPTVDGPVHLKIPGGSKTGQKLRLRGKGVPREASVNSGPGRGDQIVQLLIETPDFSKSSSSEEQSQRVRELLIQLESESNRTEIYPRRDRMRNGDGAS